MRAHMRPRPQVLYAAFMTAAALGAFFALRSPAGAVPADPVSPPPENAPAAAAPPAAVSPAAPPAAPAAGPLESVRIEGVPHVVQKPDFCGEACAEMWLRKLGKVIDQDEVFVRSGVNPAFGRGCVTRELVAVLRGLGFETGPVWIEAPAAKAAEAVEAEWRAMHADLAKGIASIVCMRFSDKQASTEHFRLVLGYDAKSDEILYHEPGDAGGAYARMARAKFLSLWPLGAGTGRAMAIRMRLAPVRLAAPMPKPAGFTAADYCQHIRALKPKIPKEFTIQVASPFVVIGDGDSGAVRRSADGTVRWAVTRLKKDFFEKDPERILDVWLFQNEESYRRHTKAIFNDEPSTPFGYYSSEHGALIMNIATGGGTLVHEIVHPFMEANVPGCPTWLNEGLGSLFEQCGDRDGHMIGATNWRLAGLQKAIREKRVPTFEALCGLNARDFYEKDRGTNYGQARYLCFYLQESGLLLKFWKEFLAARDDDPSGFKTLQRVLGETDMADFQKAWADYTLSLEFPPRRFYPPPAREKAKAADPR